MLRCARGETKLCNKESDGTRGVVDMFFPTVSFQMRYTCCAHWHACDVRVNNDQVALCNEGKAALCNEEREGDGTRGVVAGRIGALLLLSIPSLATLPTPRQKAGGRNLTTKQTSCKRRKFSEKTVLVI